MIIQLPQNTNTMQVIGVLSAVDNASIEFGDDFGFDEMTSFFS